MKVLRLGVAVAAFAIAATSSVAATVTIEKVTGEWVSVGPSNVYDLNYDTSDTMSEVRWGKTHKSGEQSGYQFAGVIPPAVTSGPDTEFDLGEFTHLNWPIKANTGRKANSITSAELRVDFEISIDSVMYAFSRFYTFLHDETPNGGDRNGNCAYGGQSNDANNPNGCMDRVTAVSNPDGSETVEADGMVYEFDISGFKVGTETLDYFLTKENAENKAVLVGSYSVSPLSAVPLPAAGWMLIAGVGGLVAMKRRKARSNA